MTQWGATCCSWEAPYNDGLPFDASSPPCYTPRSCGRHNCARFGLCAVRRCDTLRRSLNYPQQTNASRGARGATLIGKHRMTQHEEIAQLRQRLQTFRQAVADMEELLDRYANA